MPLTMPDSRIATSGRSNAIGVLPALFIVAGNMVGSGIFLLPAVMASIGSISIFSWIAALFIAIFVALVLIWLLRYAPSAQHGITAPIGKTLGPLIGFQVNFLYWISAWVGNVAIAIAMTGYFSVFFPWANSPFLGCLVTVASIWLFTGVNILGPRLVGAYSGLSFALGLIPIAVVGIAGWFWFDPGLFGGNWNPTGQKPYILIPPTIVSVFWAFAGLESAAITASIVKNPERNVPLVTIGGILLAALIYLSAVTVIMGLLPSAEIAKSASPFADVVLKLFGASAAGIIALCAIVKTSGTLSGWILVTAGVADTAARESLFPKFLSGAPEGKIVSRNFVANATLMTGAVLVTLNPVLSKQFEVLINISVLLILITYLACCVTLWRLKDRPRLGAARHLVVAMALIFCLFTVITADVAALKATGLLIAAGMACWFAPWRRKSNA